MKYRVLEKRMSVLLSAGLLAGPCAFAQPVPDIVSTFDTSDDGMDGGWIRCGY